MKWEAVKEGEQAISGNSVGVVEKLEWGKAKAFVLTAENAYRGEKFKHIYKTEKAAKEAFEKIAIEWR